MGVMKYHITGKSTVSSSACCLHHVKHRSSALPVFVRGNHRWSVVSPHKGLLMHKAFNVSKCGHRTSSSNFLHDVCQKTPLPSCQKSPLKTWHLGRADNSVCYLRWTVTWVLGRTAPWCHEAIRYRINWGVPICLHDDVIEWKHFPRYWPIVRGIHRSPVDSPHKGQWRGALMFSLICAWTNGWANNRGAGDLRRHCAHYDVIVVMI